MSVEKARDKSSVVLLFFRISMKLAITAGQLELCRISDRSINHIIVTCTCPCVLKHSLGLPYNYPVC